MGDFRTKLSIILDNRSAIMGFAIIWIFLLHSGLCDIPCYDEFISLGWMGVDIFFFLSALGLCFSLKKSNSIVDFYKRRIKRIIPTWLFVLFTIHILGIVTIMYAPNLPFYFPRNIREFFLWYTGVGYWLNAFLEEPMYAYYEWYIPTLLLFYLISPFLFRKKTNSLLLLFVIFTIIAIFMSNYEIVYSLRLSYQRLPVFILGFIAYRFFDEKISNGYFLVFLSILTLLGVGTLFISLYHNYVWIKFVPLFFMIQFLWLLSMIFNQLSIKKIFAFCGTISLELYLIHLYRRPNFLVSSLLGVNDIVCVALSLLLCVIMAYFLSKTIKIMINLLSNVVRNRIFITR